MCDVCVQAKHKQKFIRTKTKRTTMPFELVHSDICGPFATPSISGGHYFMVFVDDYSRWTDMWLLPNKKAETCTAAYQSFQKRIEAIGNYHIRRFRCDNGRGEYDNKLFRMILAGAGTSFEPCPPYAHHKNGVAERMIGTITEKARAMMIDSQAPLQFWGEAVNTAVYLHRLTPNEGLTKRDDRDGYKAAYETPYEMLHAYGKSTHDPNGIAISFKAPLHHLRRFGCFVSRLIPESQRRDKFSQKSKPGCMMVGYAHDSTTMWRVWDPQFQVVRQQSDVIFDEVRNAYISCPQEHAEKDIFGLPQDEVHIEEIDTEPRGNAAKDHVTGGTGGDGLPHGRAEERTGGTGGDGLPHGRTEEIIGGTGGEPHGREDHGCTDVADGHDIHQLADVHESARSLPARTGQRTSSYLPARTGQRSSSSSSHLPARTGQRSSSSSSHPHEDIRENVAHSDQSRDHNRAQIREGRITRSMANARTAEADIMANALTSLATNGDPSTYAEAMDTPQKM